MTTHRICGVDEPLSMTSATAVFPEGAPSQFAELAEIGPEFSTPAIQIAAVNASATPIELGLVR